MNGHFAVEMMASKKKTPDTNTFTSSRKRLRVSVSLLWRGYAAVSELGRIQGLVRGSHPDGGDFTTR